YFFTLENVDFSKQTIDAFAYENEAWVPMTIPYPDVISNIGVGQFNKEERQFKESFLLKIHLMLEINLPYREKCYTIENTRNFLFHLLCAFQKIKLPPLCTKMNMLFLKH